MAKYKASVEDLTACVASCDRLERDLIGTRMLLHSKSKHYAALTEQIWAVRGVNRVIRDGLRAEVLAALHAPATVSVPHRDRCWDYVGADVRVTPRPKPGRGVPRAPYTQHRVMRCVLVRGHEGQHSVAVRS